MQKHRFSRCRATKINTHTPRWAQCGKTGSPLPPAIPPSLRQWENRVETEWDMTGFIPRPHLFAAHANIGWRRVSFESEPEARWLAQFSSLRHKHLFLPSCFILKVDVTSLGYVIPSLKWSVPKVSSMLNILYFFPPYIFLHRLKRKWAFCVKYLTERSQTEYSRPTPVLHLSYNSELQVLHHVVNVMINTSGTEAGVFHVFSFLLSKGGYLP